MYAIVLTQPTFMQYESTNKVDNNIAVLKAELTRASNAIDKLNEIAGY